MASESIASIAEDQSSPSTTQVKLLLTTRDTGVSLPDNTGPILINTNLRRYALSTLVNTLLESPRPIPFEFLINGTFLRTSIDEYLTANGISSETTLTVEYVRATVPPLHLASFQHDDWISAVDILSLTSVVAQSPGSLNTSAPGHERILSASYDGLLRIWNLSSEVLVTSPSSSDGGHTSSIKSAKFISPTKIVSSGLDRTIKIWKYSEEPSGFSGSLTPTLELYGHRSSIDALATHAPSSRLLSASTDCTIGVWSTKKSDAPPALTSLLPNSRNLGAKRRKLNAPNSTSTPQRGPLTFLKAHSAPVSSTIFSPQDATVAYSTSWDHTLRTWDLPTSTPVDTRSTSHALLSLTTLSSLNLLATGTSARHITLIDPRASATTVSAMTLHGHTNAVVSLAPDPTSAYGLVSASHDGTCRVWDVRASRTDAEGRVAASVFVIERESLKAEGKKVPAGGEGVKVFDVAWDREVGIVSVGEDKQMQINRGKDIMGEKG